MSDPLIIQCAVTGSADPDPERRPNLPITPEQIIDEALAAWRAGATVLHLHAREDDGTPTQDRDAFARLVTGIRDAGCDAVLNLSTGTAAGGTERDDRRQPVDLDREMGVVRLRHHQLRRAHPRGRPADSCAAWPRPSSSTASGPRSSASTPATSA